MKKIYLSIISVFAALSVANAQSTKLIDLCEKNTSSSYKTYNTATSIASGSVLQVRTARYTEFYPTLNGKGALELYCGGERTFLGTKDNKTYPDWSRFTGAVDIYPYTSVEGSCGFYGAVMLTRGKAYSPEDPNPTMNVVLENNKTTLHKGAAMATEKSAAGIRIGELNTEEGSRLYGYYKSQSSATTAYYILGALNTDATLAGRIASVEKSGTPDATQSVGIVKEGTGTYTITANDNQISGGIRINSGTVLINNDAAQAKSRKLTGGTGASAKTDVPVVYVFGGRLGGTGNIGGGVDLYGQLTPGAEGNGTLTLANYATSASCNLTVHPSSAINLNLTDADTYTSLSVSGKIVRNALMQDFSESSASPQIIVTLADNHSVKPGDTFTLIKATRGRDSAASWRFRLILPSSLKWEVNETDGTSYTLAITCVDGDENPDPNPNPDENEDESGDEAFDWDAYDNTPVPSTDLVTNLGLKKYVEMLSADKCIGVAIPSWWRYAGSPSYPPSYLSTPITRNFDLCVAENEMKMDAMEPSQNYFDYGAAGNVVSYAKSNKMAVRGHTLVWHKQVPEWISSDGKKNDKNWTRTQLLSILENHITNIVRRFGSDIMEWDVVNETLDDDQSIVRTNPSAYQLRKESVWVKVIGEDFIDSAFVYAHRANPSARLYLNDYDCEYSGTAKTIALFNLARRLKEQGIPIDGVGLQCHLKADEFNRQSLDKTIRKYATIGLNALLTEVDMAISDNSTAQLQKQADAYRKITEVFLHNPNCPHMVFWGINDQYSWIADKYPLLFDHNTKEKPAYYSVQQALHKYTAIEKQKEESTFVESIDSSNAASADAPHYNICGQRVGEAYKGIVLVNGKKYLKR